MGDNFKTYRRPKWDDTFLVETVMRNEGWQSLIEYLCLTRCISTDTLKAMRITLPWRRFGGTEQRCIAFNYFETDENGRQHLINAKYRTIDKQFQLEGGAELIPYNIDAIKGQRVCYITEGEFDCLSMIECGYTASISVPNGVAAKSDGSVNLEWLDRFVESHFDDKETIVLALDNDKPGIVLRNELIRRLDADRCKLVNWPEGCKDVNDVLVKYGQERVRECVEAAEDIPLVGIQTATDVADAFMSLYEHGDERGAEAGLKGIGREPGLDDLMTFETGRYMVVSGRPGDGKSELVDEICLRLCVRHDWRIAYFSPENTPITYHLRKLCEKLTRYRFQPSKQMTPQLVSRCIRWLDRNVCHILPGYGEDGVVSFSPPESGGVPGGRGGLNKRIPLIRPPLTPPTQEGNMKCLPTQEENFTLENILQIAHRCVMKRGVRILVIDPLNRIDQDMREGMNELQWYSHVNNTLWHFAHRHKCLVILVAHPRKVDRAKMDNRKRRVEMNDINGSADFGNKADYCLIVDRDDDLGVVTAYVDKVKFKHLGRRGSATLHYDPVSGRYLPCTLHLLPPGISPRPGEQLIEAPGDRRYAKYVDWSEFQRMWLPEEEGIVENG